MNIPNTLAERNLKHEIKVEEQGKRVTFYEGNEQCTIARLDGDPASRVAAYQGILNDIYKMRAYINLICSTLERKFAEGLELNGFDPEDEDQVICSGLYFSAVALYGKCFTKAYARNVKLEDSGFKKNLTNTQSELHDKLRHLRSNWTAHGGESDHEDIVPIVVFSADGTRAQNVFFATSTAFLSLPEMKEFLSLCKPMIELVECFKTKHEADVFKGVDPMKRLYELRDKSEGSILIPNFKMPGV